LYLCVQKFKLGDPTSSETNLGPVVSLASAAKIRKQIADAGSMSSSTLRMLLIKYIVAAGATPLIPEHLFPVAQP